MKNQILLFLMLFSFGTYACDDISGTYSSVSETHWNYIVTISGEDINVNYSTYWYGGSEENYGDERYEVNTDYKGYCTKKDGGYLLKYDGKEVSIDFNPNLSLSELGEDRSLPGISGEFFKDRSINLWKFK